MYKVLFFLPARISLFSASQTFGIKFVPSASEFRGLLQVSIYFRLSIPLRYGCPLPYLNCENRIPRDEQLPSLLCILNEPIQIPQRVRQSRIHETSILPPYGKIGQLRVRAPHINNAWHSYSNPHYQYISIPSKPRYQ